MNLPTQSYLEQVPSWPRSGRHILAHYDDETIVVYQAYRPSIGRYAVAHGVFGGEFSYSRMSWVKPNFLWMMYRSGWGTKEGQETVLGLRIRRHFFDSLLDLAVPSNFDPALHADSDAWKAAVAASSVRLQWDPDHAPDGAAVERRAIQLGLRGETLAGFGQRELLEVIDLTDFVAVQRARLTTGGLSDLETPTERVYPTRLVSQFQQLNGDAQQALPDQRGTDHG